jgi:predicted nucleotidyltransferase
MMSEQDSTSTAVRIRPDIITDDFLAALRSRGVVKAYLFGSVARGEERPDSDLDLLVTLDPSVTLFQQIDLADELSRLCGRRVDLLTGIHPAFEPYITPTLVPLPL